VISFSWRAHGCIRLTVHCQELAIDDVEIATGVRMLLLLRLMELLLLRLMVLLFGGRKRRAQAWFECAHVFLIEFHIHHNV
jgi:hypothetical protein